MKSALHAAPTTRAVTLPAGVDLSGDLTIRDDALGVVVLAHGRGSSRFSPRQLRLANYLEHAGFATLILDLLTSDEDMLDAYTAGLRYNVSMLAHRLLRVTDWLATERPTRDLRIGYFGAGTGAAAVLTAAAQHPDALSAIVSRGGRPDLAGTALLSVTVPTLLIVGGNDSRAVRMNRSALVQLGSREKHLEIVRGATQLFEEPGALEHVAELATDWFDEYLPHRAGQRIEATFSTGKDQCESVETGNYTGWDEFR